MIVFRLLLIFLNLQTNKPLIKKLMKTKLKLGWVRGLAIVFALVFASAQVSMATPPVKLSIRMEKATFGQALKSIEKQSGYSFLYNTDEIDVNQSVSLVANDVDLNQALSMLTKGRNIKYTVKNSKIILEKSVPVPTTSYQQKKVAGVVVDAKGNTIPGVNVMIKGKSIGVATDVDGKFSINASNGSTLAVSSIGYKAQEVLVKNDDLLRIILEDDSQTIDEVVVVGYGTKKKVNMTGAVSSVETKSLASRPQRNLLNSLQGAVPGVMVSSKIGGDEGTTINIRGRGNLGSSSPLYIVDGVEVGSGFFTDMDPASIEAISFLKDASSSAIYGAKAAYGVVLVTTKKGKSGQLRVNYSGSYGIQRPNLLPDVVNSGDYAEMFNTAEANSNIAEASRTFTPEMIAKYRSGENPDLYPNTNWIDLLLRERSAFTKHNLQFEGGSEKMSYMLSLGYLNDQAVGKGEGNERYNFTTKTSSDLKPWLNVTSTVNFIYGKYDRTTGGGGLLEALRVPPTMVAKHSNGDYGSIKNGRVTTAAEAQTNPLRSLEQGGRGNTDTKRLLGSLAAELKLMDGLKFTNQFAYNYSDIREFSFDNKMAGVPNFLYPNTGIIAGSAKETNQMQMKLKNTQKLVYDGWFNFDKKIGEVHDLGIVAGWHADSQTYKYLELGRKKFASNDMGAIDGGSTAPEDQLKTKGEIKEESMSSYFGRASYTLMQRYLLEANFRADASSRFAKNGRWGYFPSFSAGWRLEQEEFMKPITWISGLKLRGSWGKNGNIYNINEYDTYSTFSTSGTSVIGGVTVPVVSEGRVGNPNLTWETTTTSNVGFDLDIMNGILSLSGEYYNRRTKDILVQANDIALEAGLSKDQVPARNVGVVKNNGFEFVLNHRNTFGDFSYNIGGNLTFNKNEIVDLGNKVNQLPPKEYWILRKGEAIGSFYMIEADGIYSTEDIAQGKAIPYGSEIPEAGMIKFKDQNGDGVIDDKDRTIVGNDVPNLTYGLNLELKYKNFTLSVLGQGVSNVKVYMDCEASQAFFDYSVPHEWQKDSWTPSNQGAVYPKLFLPTNNGFKYNNIQNSFWLFDASYFRIKNITFSYELPKSLLSKICLERASVFISGDNLFTFRGDKRMKDFDPERISGRSAFLNYQNITTGVNISF